MNQARRALLVTSHGGHLIEMIRILPAFGEFRTTLVTYDDPTTADISAFYEGDIRRLPFSPDVFGSRWLMIRHLARTTREALRLLRDLRPAVVVSTGSEIAIPFAYLCRVAGVPFVYVESLSRPEELSGTGRIVKPAASLFVVQWEELASKVPGAVFGGRVL